MNVTLTTHNVTRTATRESFTRYAVAIDDKLWCFADSDDDGLKLGIAIARLQLQRKMEKADNGKAL